MRVLFACFALLSAVSAIHNGWFQIARVGVEDELNALYCVGVDSSCGVEKSCPLKAVNCERGLWFRALDRTHDHRKGVVYAFKLEAMHGSHPDVGSGYCIDVYGTDWRDYDLRTAIQLMTCDKSDQWVRDGPLINGGRRLDECNDPTMSALYGYNCRLGRRSLDVKGPYQELHLEPPLQLWNSHTHDLWMFLYQTTKFTKIVDIEFDDNDPLNFDDKTQQGLLGKIVIDACGGGEGKTILDFTYSQGREMSASSSSTEGVTYSIGVEQTETVSVSGAGEVLGVGYEAGVAWTAEDAESFEFSVSSEEVRSSESSAGVGMEIQHAEGTVSVGALFGEIFDARNVPPRMARVTGITADGEEEIVEVMINVASATEFGAAATSMVDSIKPANEDDCPQVVLCLNGIHNRMTYLEAQEIVEQCKESFEDPDEPRVEGAERLKTGHVCLDVAGRDDPESDDRYVMMWNCETNDKWVFLNDGRLQRQGSEMCLNNKAGYGVYENGQEVEVYPCDETDAKWVLREDHRLQLEETEFCLDVSGTHPEVHSKVQLWWCDGTFPTNDVWYFVN